MATGVAVAAAVSSSTSSGRHGLLVSVGTTAPLLGVEELLQLVAPFRDATKLLREKKMTELPTYSFRFPPSPSQRMNDAEGGERLALTSVCVSYPRVAMAPAARLPLPLCANPSLMWSTLGRVEESERGDFFLFFFGGDFLLIVLLALRECRFIEREATWLYRFVSFWQSAIFVLLLLVI